MVFCSYDKGRGRDRGGGRCIQPRADSASALTRRRTAAQTDSRADGQPRRRTDAQTDRRAVAQSRRRTDAQTERRADGQTRSRADGQTRRRELSRKCQHDSLLSLIFLQKFGCSVGPADITHQDLARRMCLHSYTICLVLKPKMFHSKDPRLKINGLGANTFSSCLKTFGCNCSVVWVGGGRGQVTEMRGQVCGAFGA